LGTFQKQGAKQAIRVSGDQPEPLGIIGTELENLAKKRIQANA
jgi:hypothetical protein